MQRQAATISSQGVPYINYMTSDYIRAALQIDSYDVFRQQIEYSIHMALHSAPGGDL